MPGGSNEGWRCAQDPKVCKFCRPKFFMFEIDLDTWMDGARELQKKHLEAGNRMSIGKQQAKFKRKITTEHWGQEVKSECSFDRKSTFICIYLLFSGTHQGRWRWCASCRTSCNFQRAESKGAPGPLIELFIKGNSKKGYNMRMGFWLNGDLSLGLGANKRIQHTDRWRQRRQTVCQRRLKGTQRFFAKGKTEIVAMLS